MEEGKVQAKTINNSKEARQKVIFWLKLKSLSMLIVFNGLCINGKHDNSKIVDEIRQMKALRHLWTVI
jgi:hypothetical protein